MGSGGNFSKGNATLLYVALDIVSYQGGQAFVMLATLDRNELLTCQITRKKGKPFDQHLLII